MSDYDSDFPAGANAGRGWLRRLGARGIALTVAGSLFVILVAQNHDSISIDVFFWEVQMSKLVFFLGLTAFGFAMGVLASWWRQQSA